MADERIVLQVDPVLGVRALDKTFSQIERTAEKEGKKSGKEFGDEFSRSSSRSLSGINVALAGVAAAAGAAFAAASTVGVAAEFETIRTQLETLTGSASAASVVFEDLKEFSSSTPFQLADIAQASNRLISFGFSAGEVRDRVKEIGEVAAGSGSDLGDLSLIFGQIQAAGKLTGERLLQLQERAVPIGPAIAKTLGVAESAVRDLVSQGAVSAEVFQQAFASLSASGGIFEGSLDKQSQTISGVFSTLADNAKILSAEIGAAFGPSVVAGAQQLIKIFQGLAETVRSNGPSIASTVKSIADTFLIRPAKFWTDFFQGDQASNLQEINAEIAKLEGELANAEKRIASTNTTFGKLLGGNRQALKDFGNTAEALTNLRKRREELLKSQQDNSGAIREELALQAERKKQAQAEAAQLAAQQASLKALGDIGLQREQILRNQASKDLAIINEAENIRAISEQEADARRLERNRLLEQQLTAITQQENAKREAARKQALETELAAEQTLADVFGNVGKRFGDVAKSFRVNSQDVAKSLVNGFGNAAGSAFASFGKALATGENALQAFGTALLQAFGSSLVQLGTGFILQGIAQSLAGFGSGTPLIAAGAALATFGGVLSGLASGSSAAGSTISASGGGVASEGTFTQDNPSVDQVAEREDPATRVDVNISGPVFDGDETGLRIVDLINDAFENSGAVVRGAIAT